MLECWNVGMLECWNVGMLECDMTNPGSGHHAAIATDRVDIAGS